MRKTFFIASREFKATVLTKGFIFGVLITPAMLALMMFVMPKMLMKAPPKIQGRISIVDPTGAVAASVEEYLKPERYAQRRATAAEEIASSTPRVFGGGAAARGDAMKRSMDLALGQVPHITFVKLEPGTDISTSKAELTAPAPKEGPDAATALAVIVVHPDATVRADPAGTFGTYDIFIRSKLDDRFVDDIQRGMSDAIVAARLRSAGVDEARLAGITSVEKPTPRTVTAEGEHENSKALNIVIPAAFMILLLVSVMTTGQYLLTSTVEEKATRVVEVLLSAVSAMELMTGKILGQMAVGLVVLALYAALGILALITFATLGLLDPWLIVYLLIFYVLAYFTTAAMMASIGAAVNEMREAQSLMTPVMLVLMIPWLIWLPITRDPNSVLAVVLSFVPSIGNFVILLRMTSTVPPPLWQVWAAIAVGAAGAWGAMWFAAKVFRVGLLMFGKPPTLGTLVRWARMS